MMKKPAFRISLALMALVFLCNPNISLLDLLPDFIGYLCMALAITHLADAFPYFEEAKSGFYKLMWISISKCPALLLVMSTFSRDNSQKSLITVFSLCYAVLECIFLVPAFSSFFEGVFYLGDRYGCASVRKTPSSSGNMTPEKLKKLTIAFMITKLSMSTLPELSLISVKQYNPNTPISTFNSSNLYPLFLLVGCMVTLVFGLIWLVFMRRYLLQLKQEGDINALLLQHTSQNETYFTQKNLYFRIAMAFSLIIVAVVFALDLVFDDVNVMPDIISAALFASAMFLLRPHSQNATLAGGMFCLYGGIGLVSYILKGIFVHRYTFEMIEYAPKAKNLYLTHTIFSGLEGVLLVIALVALSYVVLDVCQTHNPKGDLGTQAILRKKLRIFVGIGILSALASFYYVISVSQTHPLGIGDNPFGTSGLVYVPVIEWYWMVPLAISLVWIGYAVHLMGALRDAYKDLAE